ncbi:ABC transporter substrate-binding protein [Chryseobacterium sp. G0240]|uniref:ABC transporter substrate-binding protein n=1 Tax=Chryseobacterium sp. G0240 TaxID=2487066 RepID=UPI000F4486E0|nr:ABC transporter substrate-binding protein [Chryseobacterium sp. G0240]ROI05004.1 ABC transporter substrate-binding protein [Chryseobacterium sp. G0240]
MKKYNLLLFILVFLFHCCDAPPKKTASRNFNRIVVLGQAPLEILLKLGYKDKIVGIGYLDQPEELKGIDHLPVLTVGWPDQESILALNPDLILGLESAFRSNRTGDLRFWESRGVPTCIIDNYKLDKNLESLRADLKKTGTLLGIESRTDSLILKSREVSRKYKQRNNRPSQRVLHLSYTGIGDQYYYYPPAMCLIDEIITECGGQYIDLGSNYFIIPLETIIQSDPDKIVITWFRKQDKIDVIQKLCANPFLQHLRAVKNRQIIEVDYTPAIRGTYDMEPVYCSISNFLQR